MLKKTATPESQSSRLTNWVRTTLFSAITGITQRAISRKRSEGIWLEGEHWVKGPDGKIYINLSAYEQWVRSNYTNVNSHAKQSTGRRPLKKLNSNTVHIQR